MTDKILFIPDPNLGRYVAQQLPEKEFAFYTGGCPRHYDRNAGARQKSKRAASERVAFGSPGMSAGSRCTGRLCRFDYRNHEFAKNPIIKSLLSVLKTASYSIYSLTARRSSFIH